MVNDALSAAVWFVVNLAAVAATARLARRAFTHDEPSQISMHVLVLTWASIVAICMLLGAVGLLRWEAMVAVVLLLSAAAAWATRRAHAHGALPSASTNGDLTTNGVDGHRDAPGHRLSSAPAAAWVRWLWWALAALAAAAIVQRLLEFPRYWDDLMYHLPLVDHWIQDGRLYAPGCAEWYNPGNGELLGFWLAAPFSGDFWVGAANLHVLALLTLAVLELGRELELSPLVRHAVALAAVASNVVLTQLTDLENDMAAAAAFVAALAYGARYARSGRRADRWLAAASLGLLAGVKYYALGYAAVGAVSLLGLCWAAHGGRAARHFVLATLVGTSSLAGYWYARNWLVTGTPFYPLGLSGGTDVLESVRPSAFVTTFLGNGRIDLWVQYLAALRQLTGYCQITGVLVGPSVALWLLISAATYSHGGAMTGRMARATVAMSFLAGILVFSVTPFTVADDNERQINGAFTVVRYSQCPVILGMLCLAVALDKAARAVEGDRNSPRTLIATTSIGLLLLSAGMVQFVMRGRELINLDAVLIAANLGTAGWLLRELSARSAASVWRPRLICSMAAAALLAGASAALNDRWHAGYAKNFDRQFSTQAFTRLEAGDVRARGIAVLDYRYYAFFGSRRQFRAHRPFRILSWASLLSYLSANRIDALAVVRRDSFKYGRYLGIGDLVAEHADVCQKVDAGAGFDVYIVNPRSEATAGLRETDRLPPTIRRERGNVTAPY